jgi:ABC-type transport system involved in cytochrome bd biosynthesis fused ATPase/permease subunit
VTSEQGAPPALSPPELRRWRARLLHGEWRLWDLEFFHVLVVAVNVITALLASVLVVAMTHRDGTVRVSVVFVAVLVAGLVVIRGAARSGLHAAERRASATAALEARTAMLDAVERGARITPGAASSFVTRSSAQVGAYVATAVPARSVAAVATVGVLVVVALVDPWSALVAAAVVAAAPFVLVAVGRRAEREATTSLSRLRSLGTRALELLDGAVELRALGAVARGRTELAAATDRVVASTRAALRTALWSSGALDVLAGLAVGLVAMTDGLRLLDGSMQLGHALAAVLLTVEVFAPLRAAGAAFHAGADGKAALALLDATCEGTVRPSTRGSVRDAAAPAPGPSALFAADASLRATPGGPVVVRGLNLDVPAGGAAVLRGPTGAGKTSVLRAIAGVPLLESGTLLVGNAAPAALSPRQRAATIASVAQHPLLVAGTLRENLELGSRPADPVALADAIERCGLSSLCRRLDHGLDGQVGEDGRLLSAGERTRVALARAVLRRPGVLLLDEVGAHLDDASIARLRRALGEFLATRTVVEAAHDRPLLDHGASIELAVAVDAP